MRALERIEFLNRQVLALLDAMPVADPLIQTRPQLHGDLAQFWAATDAQGRSRQLRLTDIRRAMMQAEIDLRVGDQTLSPALAATLSTLLDLPYAWQRHHHPLGRRAQVYRPTLSRIRPSWRSPLPGMFVIVTGTAPGQPLEPEQPSGPALLCGPAQGIEAYASISALHRELCERLDDPIQGPPLLNLLVLERSISNATQADRLRYEWYADDPLEDQVDCFVRAQRQRLNHAWPKDPAAAAGAGAAVRKAMALASEAGSRALLDTRYALLLERNLPNWLVAAGPQALAHIMQTMQELVATGEQVAAPGIPTFVQFQQQHSLQAWARERLEQSLRHDLGLTHAVSDILVNIVHTRQTGPHVNPLQPSSYVTWRGIERVGGELVETVRESYPLDALAMRNVAWFDFDYWLTARITHRQGKPLPAQLSPDYVKSLVRNLNVGCTYARFLKTQLLESPAGAWRLQAHGRINRARMRAEAAKARYAGHLDKAWNERAYHWVRQVIEHPQNTQRPTVDGHRVVARQLLINGHSVQGVLLIDSPSPSISAFVMYTPDAPDRRAWRSFASSFELLRLLRAQPALRHYAGRRLAQLPAAETEQLLRKGRLGKVLRTPAIREDLFIACYKAEVRSLLAVSDANSRTTLEVDIDQAVGFSWYLVDLITLVLPAKIFIPLVLGRMAIEIWSGVDAYHQDDLNAVLRHMYNALSHLNDAGTSLASTGLVRRLLRGMPVHPPLPLPSRYTVNADPRHLRFHIDGLYGEQVYEKASEFGGQSHYFIQDAQDRFYKVAFDGERWRVIDPEQPDAYLAQPVKRLANGNWVIDSPLHWYDGLPDLTRLLDDCRLHPALQGTATDGPDGLWQAAGQLYLPTARGQLPLRRHLLPGHYHLLIPDAASAGVVPWATLRWQDRQWRIRVRQAGRSSDWLLLPDVYSVSRGNRRSSR